METILTPGTSPPTSSTLSKMLSNRKNECRQSLPDPSQVVFEHFRKSEKKANKSFFRVSIIRVWCRSRTVF